MKKLLWLVVSFIAIGYFCACENGGNDEDILPTNRTYTITTDLGLQQYDEQYGTTTTLQLNILEYSNKNELVNSQVWSNVCDNDPKIFTAHQLASKLIIYIELDSKYGDLVAEINQYVAQVFHLSATNLDILINGNTLITDVQPIR